MKSPCPVILLSKYEDKRRYLKTGWDSKTLSCTPSLKKNYSRMYSNRLIKESGEKTSGRGKKEIAELKQEKV